jgi:hypothetical protein
VARSGRRFGLLGGGDGRDLAKRRENEVFAPLAQSARIDLSASRRLA